MLRGQCFQLLIKFVQFGSERQAQLMHVYSCLFMFIHASLFRLFADKG